MQVEPLIALAATVAGEKSTQAVLDAIVRGLAREPGVALARIWLLGPGDLCEECFLRTECQDQTQCLHLVASAGASLETGEDWSFLQGHFRRIPLAGRKVGRIARTGEPILVSDFAPESEWIARPDWAQREGIRGFAGHALVFRGKILGVLAIFSRVPLSEQESAWIWIFAGQASAAIANAQEFAERK